LKYKLVISKCFIGDKDKVKYLSLIAENNLVF